MAQAGESAIESATIKTFEDARAFVLRVGLCYIFSDPKGKTPSLWDAVDAPDKQSGEGGWGDKMGKVWGWKDDLPYTYPTEIFYGKLRGGRAFLSSFAVLRDLYAANHKRHLDLSAEAKRLYEIVERDGRVGNPYLRTTAGMGGKESKSRYERALTELQVAFYIVRIIDKVNETWYWQTFARWADATGFMSPDT